MTEISSERMYEILNNHIQRKLANVNPAIEKMERDNELMHDYVIPSGKLHFHPDYTDPARIMMGIKENTSTDLMQSNYNLHKNAVRQFSAIHEIPLSYTNNLMEGNSPWRIALLAYLMNEHTNHRQSRQLIRIVGTEARAIMSDRYKRLNSMAIYQTFLEATKRTGARVVDAHYDDLTGFIEVLLPQIFDITNDKNDQISVVFGAQIRNSDFGVSKLDVRIYLMSVRCANGMTGESVLSQVHLGSQIPDNILISDQTYDLETKHKASLVSDVMNNYFSRERLIENAERIRKSINTEIDIPKYIEMLPKMGMLQGEVENVKKALMENNPDSGVVGSNSLWKLANAVSWVGNNSDAGRQRELAEVAHAVMVL